MLTLTFVNCYPPQRSGMSKLMLWATLHSNVLFLIQAFHFDDKLQEVI